MNKTRMDVFNQYADGKMTMEEAMLEIHPPRMLRDWAKFIIKETIAWSFSIIVAFSFLHACNAHASPATDAIKACAPYREMIADAAEAESVPASLLTALVFAESSCDASKVNRKGACGLGQVLLTGAGEGYTQAELLDPWTNLRVVSAHLSKWKRRCGSWRGAVSIYNGSGRCSKRTEFSAKVVRLWRSITKAQEVRS